MKPLKGIKVVDLTTYMATPATGRVSVSYTHLDVYKRQDVTVDALGTAKTVKVSKDATVIVDGAGDKAAIDARVAQMRNELEHLTSDFDKEKLQERLSKLSGGVAVLKVGAATESELKEKKSRIEDALQATRAAVEEGIVAGDVYKRQGCGRLI